MPRENSARSFVATNTTIKKAFESLPSASQSSDRETPPPSQSPNLHSSARPYPIRLPQRTAPSSEFQLLLPAPRRRAARFPPSAPPYAFDFSSLQPPPAFPTAPTFHFPPSPTCFKGNFTRHTTSFPMRLNRSCSFSFTRTRTRTPRVSLIAPHPFGTPAGIRTGSSASVRTIPFPWQTLQTASAMAPVPPQRGQLHGSQMREKLHITEG